MSRIVGVLGGTFDPVHLGHLHIASHVQKALSLPGVLLIPSAKPPHKTHGAHASAADRLAMVQLAVAHSPGLAASSLEVDRGGVCYTIDTLRTLRDREGQTPVFIIGMDALEEISTWHEFAALLREFDFVVVDRAGGSLTEAARRFEPAGFARLIELGTGMGSGRGEPAWGAGGRVVHLPIPLVDISSSLVRARAAAGQPLDGLVPPAVAGYIRSRHLYREESPR